MDESTDDSLDLVIDSEMLNEIDVENEAAYLESDGQSGSSSNGIATSSSTTNTSPPKQMIAPEKRIGPPDINDEATNSPKPERKKRRGYVDGEEEQVPFMSYELQQGYRILRELLSDANKSLNFPFIEEVDVEKLGLWDYYEKIEQPMCLKKMKENFLQGKYDSITQFVSDFRLMLENCYRYNGPDHYVSKKGQKLEQVMEQKLSLLSRELREKTTLDATNTDSKAGMSSGMSDSDMDFKGIRRRGRIIQPHDSTALLNQLRREEALKEKEFRRQQILEKKHEKEQYYHDLVKWDETIMGGPEGVAQMKAMWELPNIGLFLFLCQEPLRLWEVPQFELERAFYLPRESSTMQRVMTSLLRTQSQRIRDVKKPLFTYRQWNYKLKAKLLKWYKTLEERKSAEMASRALGIDPWFFTVLGQKNPLEKKWFHELTTYQRVWIVKAICDHSLEFQDTLREAIECNHPADQKEYLLGTDGEGNTYIHFPQFCGQDLRIYRQSPFKYPKFDKPKPKPIEIIKRPPYVKKSAPSSPKKSPAKRKRVSDLPSTPTNRPSRLRQVIKPVLKPQTPDTSDIDDDVQSLSSYCSSTDTRAARALRREQVKGIQMVHSKQTLDRMLEKERTMMDLLDGEETSMDCDSLASFSAKPDLKSLEKAKQKLLTEDTHTDSCKDEDQASVGTGSHFENGDGDDTISSLPGCFSREKGDSEMENMDSDSFAGKSCFVPNNDSDSDIPSTAIESDCPFVKGAESSKNSNTGVGDLSPLNGNCDSNVMQSSVVKSEPGAQSDGVKIELGMESETVEAKDSDSSDMYPNGRVKSEHMDSQSVLETDASQQREESSLGVGIPQIKNEPGAFQGIGTSNFGVSQEVDSPASVWETNSVGSIQIKREVEDHLANVDGEVDSIKQEPVDSEFEEPIGEADNIKQELVDSEPEFTSETKEVKQEDFGADNVKHGVGAEQVGIDDDDDDVRIIGEEKVDKDVMIIEKVEEEEEEMEPVLPDLAQFELMGETVEVLRALVKQFEEPEVVTIRKGKKETVIKPPPRKKCVGELHERLVYLLKELDPWENKLIQANRKMRERVKKEVDEYEEPEEPEEITIGDDSSTSGSEDSSDDDSDSDSSETSSDNKAAEKGKGKRKLEGNSDSESADVSLRGRTRKRRRIPDNAAEEYEKGIARKKPAKKILPSTANESKTSQTAIQSAIRNLRLPPNHVLIKTSQGYSIVNSALLQNAQFCAALNPTVIRTVAPTTVTSSTVTVASSTMPAKTVIVQNVSQPVVRVVTSTVGAPSLSPSSARSVLIQQLSKPLPHGSDENKGNKKVTTISAIPISATPRTSVLSVPQKPHVAQHNEKYVNYSGLADMPQRVIHDLIMKQRKSDVQVKPTPTTTPAAKILSSMLSTPEAHKKTSAVTSVAPALPVTIASTVKVAATVAPAVVTSVLSLATVTQPINTENWNTLLKANPGLLKLVQSPQKSSKYASNITVKSLLETRASMQKSPKSETEASPLTVVVTENQDVVMTDASTPQMTPLPTAQVETSHIDQMVKSVMSPIKTTLPTVQIKIPSPSTLPAITQHNVTSTTRAMKVPIPAAISPTTGTKSSSAPSIKVQNASALSVPGAAASAGGKIVLGSKQSNQLASIIGGEQKNIVLKVVPQTIMTTQGLVQGYVTPQGLFIPKQMLNTPTVLSVKADGTPATVSSASSSQVNTANQTVKAIVSPGTVQTLTGQGNLVQVATNPAVPSTPIQKIVVTRAVVSGSQTVNILQGLNPGGLLQVPMTLPLTAVPVAVNNRGVVVQKRIRSRGGIMTAAVRQPVMSPTVARTIEFTEANCSTSAVTEVSPLTTHITTPSRPEDWRVVQTSDQAQPPKQEGPQAASSSSNSDGFADLNSIFGKTTDADTVAALQSLVQLSGLVPPDPIVSAPCSNNRTELVSPVSSVPMSPQPSVAQQSGLLTLPGASSSQEISKTERSVSPSLHQDDRMEEETPKKVRPRGNIGLQQHAALHGLLVEKPQGANVYTVNIAKTDPSMGQLSQQKIMSNQITADVASSVQQTVGADQVVKISPQKVATSPTFQVTPQQLLALQNQLGHQLVGTSNSQTMQVQQGNAAKNMTSVPLGKPSATPTLSRSAPCGIPGVPVQSLGNEAQGTSKVSFQVASSVVASANTQVNPSLVSATVQHQVIGNTIASKPTEVKIQPTCTVSPASVVGQQSGQAPGQQKLILFNIGGQLVTPQGIPVTISQGVVKMLPKTTSASTSASTANALKQAQLQLALQQLQTQQQVQVKVQGQAQTQGQQQAKTVTGSFVTTTAQRSEQSHESQVVTTPAKPQASAQQILQTQLNQVLLMNQMKQSQGSPAAVIQTSLSQAQPTLPSSIQVPQRPVTLQLPQQQIALQQGFLQQLQNVGQKSQPGQLVPQSNIMLQVMPQNANHLQQTQVQGIQQSTRAVQPTTGVKQVQLATGVHASVHGGAVQLGQPIVAGVPSTIKTGQQVIQLGQPSVQQVQRTVVVPTSGQQVHTSGQHVQQLVQLGQPTSGQPVQQLVQLGQPTSGQPVQQLVQLGQPTSGQHVQQGIVQLGQQSLQKVQHTGVPTSGQQVQHLVGGVHLAQQSLQQLVGGVQRAQPRPIQIQPQSAMQVLQQASIASTHGTAVTATQQTIQVQQPGQTVVRFQQLHQLMQQQEAQQQGKGN
ncbi:uncharacterized protein LOC135492146 isoform X2 [Lineus longissimus]|uniref:uncharacterized protein LOC135492146 isoform X2 n=1 Tax=Lineus longissimus TaxID=88925 RepID=UPI00315D44E7